jgi:hypothetical protein
MPITRNQQKMINLKQEQIDETNIQPYINFLDYINSVEKYINIYSEKFTPGIIGQYVEKPIDGFNRNQRCYSRSLYNGLIQNFDDKMKIWYKNNIDSILDINVKGYNKEYIDSTISDTRSRLDIMRHNITCIHIK